MKRLVSMLLILSLALAVPALAQEAAAPRLGYIAPHRPEGARASLAADAFAYAAEQKGAVSTIVRYDPGSAGAEGDAAAIALQSMLEEGVDGVVAAPETLEQAARLIELAGEAGVPIAIVGMDISAAVKPDEAGELPYVAALTSGEAAAFTAAKWLEDYADSPLMFHCALPEADPAIQAGISRALAGAQYLELADEIRASADSAAAGANATGTMFNSYTMFYCVLADSEALAEGCAAALKSAGESMPIAAIGSTDRALELLRAGTVDMVAGTPAPVEGMRAFQVMYDYLTQGALPEDANRIVTLDVVTATSADSSAWIAGDDLKAAYALVFPEAKGAQ